MSKLGGCRRRTTHHGGRAPRKLRACNTGRYREQEGGKAFTAAPTRGPQSHRLCPFCASHTHFSGQKHRPPETGRSRQVHCGAPRTHIMAAVYRFALGTPVLLASLIAIAGARGEEARPVRAPPEHACLDQKERRAEIASGGVVRLVTAIRAAKSRMPGTVVQARLCHGQDGLVYVLTVLARDGKVARIVVDAAKGTLVGER